MLLPIPQNDPEWQDFISIYTPVNKWLNYGVRKIERARCVKFLQNKQQTFLPLTNKNITTHNLSQFAVEQIEKSAKSQEYFSQAFTTALQNFRQNVAKIDKLGTDLSMVSNKMRNENWKKNSDYKIVLIAQ